MPAGRSAVRAWRALPADLRRRIRADAGAGHPAGDPGLATIAAGYGRTMGRMTMWVPLPMAFTAVAVAIGISTIAGQETVEFVGLVFLIAALPVLLAVLGLTIGAVVVRRRSWRLYAVNVAAAEAALLTATPAVGGPGVEGPAGGVAAGGAVTGGAVTEIVLRPGSRLRKYGRALFVVAMLVGLLLVLPRLDTGVLRTARSVGTVVCWIGIALGLVALLLGLVQEFGSLTESTVLRLHPQGWEIPMTGQRGSWAEVTGIGVHRYWRASRTEIADIRVVTFQVTDPRRHLEPLAWNRRWGGARSLRRFGSPVGFLAMPQYTVPVSDALALIGRYTDAPVTWH